MNPLDVLTEIEAEHERCSRELVRVLSAAAYVPSIPSIPSILPPSRWPRLFGFMFVVLLSWPIFKLLKGETNGHDR